MTTDLVTVGPSTSVSESAVLMARHEVGSLLIVKDGELLGIFTERDILRALAQTYADRGRSAPIAKWMSADPLTISPKTSVKEALTLMMEGGFRHLPVAEDQTVVGMVSMRDLGGFVLASMDSDL